MSVHRQMLLQEHELRQLGGGRMVAPWAGGRRMVAPWSGQGGTLPTGSYRDSEGRVWMPGAGRQRGRTRGGEWTRQLKNKQWSAVQCLAETVRIQAGYGERKIKEREREREREERGERREGRGERREERGER